MTRDLEGQLQSIDLSAHTGEEAVTCHPNGHVEVWLCGQMLVVDADKPAMRRLTPTYPAIVIEHTEPSPKRSIIFVSGLCGHKPLEVVCGS